MWLLEMRLSAWVATEAMVRLGGPVEALLTRALRRLGRDRPDVFDRLGDCRTAGFVISPDNMPVAFRMVPDGDRGVISVVRKGRPGLGATTISAPLSVLLSLLDGGTDADSAFFSRRVRVAGDTGTAVALHNTLEAAELTLADVLGLPRLIAGPVNAVAESSVRHFRSIRRRMRER